MKSVFKSAGRIGQIVPLILLGILMASPFSGSAQPSSTYISPPSVTSPPQVNATNFINSGVWNIFTAGSPPVPYQTSSTYNWTNTGTMNCYIGWEFDYGPYPVGARGWSANFFNDTPGTISAQDLSVFPSLLLIQATNIVNKGQLSTGALGLLILKGSTVNLNRGGLEISGLAPSGSSNGQTNFTPDTAIYDEFWRGGTNALAFDGQSLWDGYSVGSVLLNGVGEVCGVSNASVVLGPYPPQVAISFTNALKPGVLLTTNSTGAAEPPITIYSNLVRQAIFVYVSDPNITPSARFGQSLGVSNIFLPAAVRLLTVSSNVVTGAQEVSTIYVRDTLAAVGTNGALLKSTYFDPGAACQAPTYRPESVNISRTDNGFAGGNSGNGGWPSDTFFYQDNFSNAVAMGQADTYSVRVDNLSAQPPAGFSVTNAPGRVEVYAKELNLNRTRITASAGIVISASNLISSAGATLDCQNLSFNLGSTNGLLNVTNLAIQSVSRFYGTVSEWSGFWTNYQVDIYTNYIQDTTTSNWVPANITNMVEVDLAITVVDAGGLSTTLPVNVLNMSLHSTNLIVSDTFRVNTLLLLDGQSLTINGGISLGGSLVNWDTATAPTLRYFTNNGTLSIPEEAYFGSDGPTNYAVFVNNGTINAGTERVNSDVFLNGGTQTTSGGFYVTTGSGRVENASIASDNDVQFNAGTLKLNNATITAKNQLYFAVTNSLFDAGGATANFLICYNGFDFAVKPATGALLGTALQTVTPKYGAVEHYWSALDLGNTTAGYTNNLALGQLVLVEGQSSEFIFGGTGASNAIYVDLLDLSQCPDFNDSDVFTIAPNLVIYYAAAKLPTSFTVPPNADGIPQEPEEYLNGKFGGHLQWVNSFVGPNSSVDVLINGKTSQVNKALRYSQIIDSNNNGIPNYFDANPFDPPPVVLSGSVVTNNPPPARKFAITWTAFPNTVYQVQYSTNLTPPVVWTLLQNYTNSTASNVVATVSDTNVLSSRRFYRVSHP
jgi:hypothetical protein